MLLIVQFFRQRGKFVSGVADFFFTELQQLLQAVVFAARAVTLCLQGLNASIEGL